MVDSSSTSRDRASDHHIAYLSLGSNLGDRWSTLEAACCRLQAQESLEVVRLSQVYETQPQYRTDQPHFLNMVVEMTTDLSPAELLAVTSEIETQSGRIRLERYGPRTLDIDVILFDTVILDVDDLQIPHPRYLERAFVCLPLLEIAPDLIDPRTGVPVRDLVADLPAVGIHALGRLDVVPSATMRSRPEY